MIDLALQSTAPWCWLASIFAAPLDAEAIAASRIVANEFAAISPMPSLVPGLRQMYDALDALPAGPEGVAALSRSYTLLFSGAGGANAVPPYESAFTLPDNRLYGPSESRMRGLLAELDLRVAEGVAEPADHLAIELAAMAALTNPAAPAAHRSELVRNLNAWLPAFSAACAAQDRCGFYAGAALLAAALAAQERATDAAEVQSTLTGENQ